MSEIKYGQRVNIDPVNGVDYGPVQGRARHAREHHDHALGEWIGIRALVDHVVTFERNSG